MYSKYMLDSGQYAAYLSSFARFIPSTNRDCSRLHTQTVRIRNDVNQKMNVIRPSNDVICKYSNLFCCEGIYSKP
jgi:hypothetical protein